jgi:hypothetical protein
MNDVWYRRGLKFSCQQCGRCCHDQGEYTQVYVDREEIGRMAAHLDLYPDVFFRRFMKRSEGFYALRSRRGACIMLRGGRCRIYPARPRQCRTWPFWAENLRRHVWYGEVRKRCPGIGKGRRYGIEEIEKILLRGDPVS